MSTQQPQDSNTPVQPDKDARLYGMLCHLTALSLYIGIPFGNIIGPLIVWLIKKDQYPFVDEQGKESLNFQISITIYAIVASLLILIAIGVVILIALGIFAIIMVIMASIQANNGASYKYPLTIKFLK